MIYERLIIFRKAPPRHQFPTPPRARLSDPRAQVSNPPVALGLSLNFVFMSLAFVEMKKQNKKFFIYSTLTIEHASKLFGKTP
jgi:hypothetical protein